MDDDFDPYYKWLAIPLDEQPPDNYRLLGLQRFEDDADVISNAADQRMAHLRSFQVGRHAKLSQALLNQVSAAKLCLLNATHKAEYDVVLRKRIEAEKSPERTAAITPPPPAPTAFAPLPFTPATVSLPRSFTAAAASPPQPPPLAPPVPGENTGAKLDGLFDNLAVAQQARVARAREKLRKETGGVPDGRSREEQVAARMSRLNAFVTLLFAAVCLLGVVLADIVMDELMSTATTGDAEIPKINERKAAILQDAVLVMTFESDTLFTRHGHSYVRDLSDQGNDGVIKGGRQAKGKCGSGFSFDGNDDYLRISDHDSLDVSKTYTISLWVMPGETGGSKHATLVSKDGPGTDTSGAYNVYCGDSIRYEVNNCHPELETDPGIVRPGAWYHIALVVDAASTPSATLYVDGVLAAATDLRSPAITDTDLCIGRRGFADGHFFGVIDELAILNRALTKQEVHTLLQAGIKNQPLLQGPWGTP